MQELDKAQVESSWAALQAELAALVEEYNAKTSVPEERVTLEIKGNGGLLVQQGPRTLDGYLERDQTITWLFRRWRGGSIGHTEKTENTCRFVVGGSALLFSPDGDDERTLDVPELARKVFETFLEMH